MSLLTAVCNLSSPDMSDTEWIMKKVTENMQHRMTENETYPPPASFSQIRLKKLQVSATTQLT